MQLTRHALSAGAVFWLAPSVCAQQGETGLAAVGDFCGLDTDCGTGCCGTFVSPASVCLEKDSLSAGGQCFTADGCECQSGDCVDDFCKEAAPSPAPGSTACVQDSECDSGCCASMLSTKICIPKATQGLGQSCDTEDGCDCIVGSCTNRLCPVCPDGTNICDDPHMQGLRGQTIDWSGVDGGWYCLVSDDSANLHVNVRLTAPLPDDFPDRQVITGVSIISGDNSLVVEVKNPYDVHTDGCPGEVSRCLADGGLRAIVNGEEADDILRPSRNKYVADGIALSASNLPVQCRQFGGDKVWARMYEEMLQGNRELAMEDNFEEWILRFDNMAAPDWCTRYVTQHDLVDVLSNHAIFKIMISTVTVRLNVGTNYQGDGELDWDGRLIPDLEFWQMDLGLHGLSVESDSLSGILGETARPVLDQDGHEVMKGFEAFRGVVEDYRVSGSLGTAFALLDKL